MADHKNQHFVPRVHLKPFSVDGAGTAIHLFLLGAGRAVLNAPVKGQCARHYIYGGDGRLERLLGNFESDYGRLLRALEDDRYRLNETDRWLLRYFLLLQSHRTAEQMERGLARMIEMADFFRAAEEAHGKAWDPANDPTPERVMLELMLSFNEQMQERVLDDLKVVLIRNRTRRDFITSDDPAVTTNRWLLQRKSISTFGSRAAGLIMFMPLGPRLLALNYDAAVYAIPVGANSMADLTRETDVIAFNEHQFQRAAAAVYFRDADDAPRLSAEHEAVKHLRPAAWDAFDVARRDGGTATHARFAIGDKAEVAQANEILFHLRRQWPTPSRWPSILRYRGNAHGFSKGRIIVRKGRIGDELYEGGSYRRVR